MNTNGTRRGITFIAAVFCSMATVASAEQTVGADDLAQANNPLANFTALSLHNYFIGELTSPDKDANQFWVRFAKPFSPGDTHWIMRASLPQPAALRDPTASDSSQERCQIEVANQYT